jgi:hypothetical protein
MIVVPGAIPVTTPVAEPIVAIDKLLLLQLPPVVTFARVTLAPTQAVSGPVIGCTIGLIVITAVV